MADIQVAWRGLALGGIESPYYVQSITGWDDSADINDLSSSRSRGHGDHVGDLFSAARIVTVSGQVADRQARDALIQALISVSMVSSVVEDLSIVTFGQELTTGARLIRRSLPVDLSYGAGLTPFALQWKCPDPLRYGPVQANVSTGLPTSGGGVSYPLTYPLDYGVAGAPGQVTAVNTGTAPAPLVLQVTGSLPSGFEVSAGDQRLRYETEVPSGEALTVDTGAGTVLAQGTADRRANLTVADWIQVPPMSSVTLQFTSLGGAFDAAAQLTVVGFRSASW